MIDFSQIGKYQENNRIEAKLAAGGLPDSIWETYSAFANTIGGVILLGVREMPDHTLVPVGLRDPQSMAALFWELVNSPRKASSNILAPEHVQIIEAEGNRIIAIAVPRADRHHKPVFVNGNIQTGTRETGGSAIQNSG